MTFERSVDVEPTVHRSAAADQLRSFVERIERLNEERKALSEDVSDVYKEAKANGFDVPALKVVIRRREKDPHEISELEAVVETYEAALGAVHTTRAGASHDEQEAA